jgi:PTS system glucitol/sorbitol-specific IIA component
VSTLGEAQSAVRFEATVTAVGPQVAGFLDAGLLVLFGSHAPVELHAMSVLHEASNAPDHGAVPQRGDVIEIGSHRLEVLAVGDAVARNFIELGHASLKADGRTEPALPGDICVPEGSLPLPQPGDVIRIVAT